jgi:hypothetical protein
MRFTQLIELVGKGPARAKVVIVLPVVGFRFRVSVVGCPNSPPRNDFPVYLIFSVRFSTATPPKASVTCTVNGNSPACVGEPMSTPVAGLKLRPAGRLPEVTTS